MCGIYTITNTQNNKQYIGSAKNIVKRWTQHKRELKQNCHYNPHLQSAWNKYGAKAFNFGILEKLISEDLLIKTEQKWINTLNPNYNISLIADSPPSRIGCLHTPETKLKMSLGRKGKKNPMYNNHRFAGKNSSNYGKHLLETTKEKIRQKHLGTFASKETRRKMSLKRTGKKNGNWKGGISYHYKRKQYE